MKHSDKTFLRLVQAVKKWGEARGAKRLLVQAAVCSILFDDGRIEPFTR